MSEDALSARIIGCAIEVHRALGPGLLESAYESCLARELDLAGLSFERQVPIPLDYKGLRVDCSFRIDLLIDRRIVAEIKAIDKVLPVHEAQLLTYLKLTGCRIGLLLNFKVALLRDGIRRLVLG